MLLALCTVDSPTLPTPAPAHSLLAPANVRMHVRAPRQRTVPAITATPVPRSDHRIFPSIARSFVALVPVLVTSNDPSSAEHQLRQALHLLRSLLRRASPYPSINHLMSSPMPPHTFKSPPNSTAAYTHAHSIPSPLPTPSEH
ncbi:hypothetical protein GUJ93_ZPchr0010g7426 [Zizania palustris]|uniref:Uncharacterized protein n=1 Tax=Zizania palustris TaxID=103762 RepID=A0A8J5WE63_ZIZPA|nr:hypothetical protein GUJ93_ZPchr0010g7426 [Zizania palustris]